MLLLLCTLFCPTYALDVAYAGCGCHAKAASKSKPAKENIRHFSLIIDAAVTCKRFQELHKTAANDFIGTILHEAEDHSKPWIGNGQVKVENGKTKISADIEKRYDDKTLKHLLQTGLEKICADEKTYKKELAEKDAQTEKKKCKKTKQDCYICTLIKKFKKLN